MRREGSPTPQIAAWVPVASPFGAEPMYRRVLDAYEAAEPDLLFTADDGRPTIFAAAATAPDPDGLAEIAAAGVLAVPMWGNLDASTLSSGTAGWMQPCTDGGQFTTLVEPGKPCNQSYATATPLGTIVSVSRSFQVGYASLPFQASGRLGGLTLQKQMETALAVQPDVLIFNAWNEHIAQPQANPYDPWLGGLRRSMGVTDASDDTADWLWVDLYGADLNRDLEPTVEDGGAGLALLQSCLRVWRTGATTCSDASEACCALAEGRTLIRSVRYRGADPYAVDHVPTSDPAEASALVASGAWEEVCNPLYGPPGLCTGTDGDGPFGLFPNPGSGRVPIHRCWTGLAHFLSPDPACEGTTTESLLGYAASAPSSDMPRPLQRCYAASAQRHLHWLDTGCPGGTSTEAVLGWVR
jgi:hypothetical protein